MYYENERAERVKQVVDVLAKFCKRYTLTKSRAILIPRQFLQWLQLQRCKENFKNYKIIVVILVLPAKLIKEKQCRFRQSVFAVT